MNSVAAPAGAWRTEGRLFYVGMAAAFVVVAFGGFSPTYWAPLAAGSFRAPPIIHIHGMLMFLWTLFYLVQNALVATGRTPLHRTWGLAGISLFTVILCAILVGEMAVIKRADAAGQGDAARRFAAVTLCAWPVMAGLFAAAIANIRRPQIHKRLMLVLMSGMMTPAIARVTMTLLAPPGAAAAGPPPPFVSIPPALLADVFLIVAVAYDWKTRGRPHPAYLAGGAVLLAEQLLAVPFAATATWMQIATAFERLAG